MGSFLNLYNQLDKKLCEITNTSVGSESFMRRVNVAAKSNASVRRHLDTLRLLANLRNAIAHEEGYPIAVPRSETVESLKAIVAAVCEPRSALSASNLNPVCFMPEDPLSTVLGHMKTGDFSQVLVRVGTIIRLLTTEGIASWLRSSIKDDLVSLNEVVIGDVLPHEPQDTWAFAAKCETVYDVREKFLLRKGVPRLFAVIVTEKGRQNEKPLGIITAWDLSDL